MKKVAAMPGPGQYSSSMEIVDSIEPQSHAGSVRMSLMDNPELLNSTKSVTVSSKRSQSFNRKPLLMNTTMSKIGKSLTSTIRNDTGNAFSRANDRFRAPTQKK